jgi:hypothetical protein
MLGECRRTCSLRASISILGDVRARGGCGTEKVCSLAGNGAESVEGWEGQSGQSADRRCVPFKYVEYCGQKARRRPHLKSFGHHSRFSIEAKAGGCEPEAVTITALVLIRQGGIYSEHKNIDAFASDNFSLLQTTAVYKITYFDGLQLTQLMSPFSRCPERTLTRCWAPGFEGSFRLH